MEKSKKSIMKKAVKKSEKETSGEKKTEKGMEEPFGSKYPNLTSKPFGK